MAALLALGSPPVPEIFATMEEGPVPGGTNPGEAWLESHGRRLGHSVAGTWLRPDGRESLECREATTGRALAVLPAADSSDVAAAWPRVTQAPVRSRCDPSVPPVPLSPCPPRLAATLSGDRGLALSSLLSLAGGRPLCRTLGADLPLALRLLQEPAGGAQLGPPGLEGWRPLGVVAVVLGGPCSLPVLLWKLGPLLAMGECRGTLGDIRGPRGQLGTVGTLGVPED
ncbi:A16A1 dehydrogenase, partial [Peucedramus taeniatus]|nr:A16A1 dehydrogenase [Peucedramus taeniatus]